MAKIAIYLLIGIVAIYFLADTGIINLDASESAFDGIVNWFKSSYDSAKTFIADLI